MAQANIILVCMTRNCKEYAVTFCADCKQLFCSTHNELHQAFSVTLATPHQVISAEDYQQREDHVRFCQRHENSPIVLACEHCFEPMCPKCFDDRSPRATACPVAGQEKHTARSIDEIAGKIKSEVHEHLSKLRAQQLAKADDMKKRRNIHDNRMEVNRTDLERLKAKVNDLQEMIKNYEEELNKKVKIHMTGKEEVMKQWEIEYSEFTKNCEDMHQKATKFVQEENEVIVNNRERIRKCLEELEVIDFGKQSHPTEISISIHDKSIELPIQLKYLSELEVTELDKKSAAVPETHIGESIDGERKRRKRGSKKAAKAHYLEPRINRTGSSAAQYLVNNSDIQLTSRHGPLVSTGGQIACKEATKTPQQKGHGRHHGSRRGRRQEEAETAQQDEWSDEETDENNLTSETDGEEQMTLAEYRARQRNSRTAPKFTIRQPEPVCESVCRCNGKIYRSQGRLFIIF